MPALYALAFRRLLPERFAIVGAARTEGDRRRVPRADEAGRPGARPRPVRRGGVAAARRRHALRHARLRRRQGGGRAARHAGLARQGARDAGEPRLLLRGAAERDRDARRRDRGAAVGRGLDQADHREAVRARPRVGARAERADPGALHRGRGLPHRPLPRQGDGAEHAGAAVRERHLRADLEPAVHRPRADHRRRVDRDRGRAPATTSRRARSATSSRTTCCSSSRSRRWSRRSTSRPTRCATRR